MLGVTEVSYHFWYDIHTYCVVLDIRNVHAHSIITNSGVSHVALLSVISFNQTHLFCSSKNYFDNFMEITPFCAVTGMCILCLPDYGLSKYAGFLFVCLFQA